MSGALEALACCEFSWLSETKIRNSKMNSQSESAIAFELLENAVDSIARAIELMAWEDISDERSRLKQAILSVSHGVELLLKERLRRVHPALVWEDVDKYPRLDARTIGVDKAIHRLSSIGAVSLGDDDIQLVKSLRNTRNAIEHFSWQTTRQEASLIVGRALSFAVAFAGEHLSYDVTYRFKRDDTWQQLIEKSSSFLTAHAARHERRSAIDYRIPCNFCNAMTIGSCGGACPLCGHWNEAETDDPF